MAYQVIARKWRPQKFSDMVGQEHIAQTLRNAIMTGRIAQAYLFVGPRGIGKTTSARIFAKALNCKHPVNGEPCCECDSCISIANESSVDVIEIDAATHTQVEKAREICEEVLHLPIASKYKIYIIDEVHMLSKSAWNALLKTIEEPPEHAKFIFATTEVNKVLPTVISRCQRFDLKRIPTNLIAERLSLIAKTEGVQISPSAIDVIARAADGGMRDAQSLLDQMISFFGSANGENSRISEAQALSLFGLTAPAEMSGLIQAILCNDRPAVITAIHKFAAAGKNLELLFDEILVWLRGIMMCTLLPNPETVLEESQEKIAIYAELAKLVRPDSVQRLLEQLSSTGFLLREAINKQIFIETLLLKAMRMAHAVQVDDLIARLNYIRKNGELGPLDAVPAYVTLPPPQVVLRQTVEAAPATAPKPEIPSSPSPTAGDETSGAVRAISHADVSAKPASHPLSELDAHTEKPASHPVSEPVAYPKTPAAVPVRAMSETVAETSVPEQVPETSVPEQVAGTSVPERKIMPQEPSGTPAAAKTVEETVNMQPSSQKLELQNESTHSSVQEKPSARSGAEDSSDEESSDESDDSISDEPENHIDINQILGKRKSVEELISEVREIPIVNDIVRSFGGRLVDVHEIAEDPDKR